MRNGATTLAVAMLSRPWKTAVSAQMTFIRCLSSSMKSLTSALWRRRRTITKTGSHDLGPTWPEAWSGTKGQHSFAGCCPFAFPHRDNAGKRWPSTNYAKEAFMVQSVTYQSETKTVPFQGKSIVLESLTPVLSPKEKEKRKKEIERCLYEVFSKYRRAGDTPA